MIKKSLAACVNIGGPVQSHYQWEGQYCREDEYLLIMKTRRSLFEELKAAFLEAHPYDTPEVIALPIEQGSEAYLNWITSQTTPKNG